MSTPPQTKPYLRSTPKRHQRGFKEISTEVKVSVSTTSLPTPSRGLAQRQALRCWIPKLIPLRLSESQKHSTIQLAHASSERLFPRLLRTRRPLTAEHRSAENGRIPCPSQPSPPGLPAHRTLVRLCSVSAVPATSIAPPPGAGLLNLQSDRSCPLPTGPPRTQPNGCPNWLCVRLRSQVRLSTGHLVIARQPVRLSAKMLVCSPNRIKFAVVD